MPVFEQNGSPTWRRRTSRESLVRWFGWLLGVAVFMVCWQRLSESTTWFFVWDAPRIADDIWTRATPPRWEYITQLGRPIWDTLNIATLGTMIALCLSVPVAFLAARNTTPSRYFIRPIALLIIVATRSINSLIWALLLIAIIGPGVFAGVIAIAIRSIGFCAKLLYEAIEEIDQSQVEAILATGASRWQVMAFGIVPQIMPAFCRCCSVPLGHQHTGIHGTGAGGRRGHWPAIVLLFECSGLASGQSDPLGDPLGRGDQRMGLSQGAGRHHMSEMTAEEAFLAYEAVRHRLPSPAIFHDRSVRHVASLAEIADQFDVFLLDAFGVLNIGETVIPGTPERVADLKAAGKIVSVVSNAASLPVADLLQKYHRLGYEFDLSDIVTSRAAMAVAMHGTNGARRGVMGPDSTALDDFDGLDWVLLGDEVGPFDEVDGFLLMGSGSWTPARQSLLESALMARPRPVLVANPDIVAPRETGFSQEPGHFAHQLADRVGVDPTFYGKPFPSVFDLALSRLGEVDKSRVVMIGDSLHTDILGAQAHGIRSALIADYGFFAGQDVHSAMQRSGIFPDFLVTRP